MILYENFSLANESSNILEEIDNWNYSFDKAIELIANVW